MRQDIDDFIIIANRLMKSKEIKKEIKGVKPERIKVNDKSATNGWF